MEGVHRVIVSLAEEPGQFLIVDIGNLTETLISGQQVGRSLESVPQSGLSHIQSQPLLGIMGHHSAIARQYGMHAQFLHALQDLFLQLLLTVIPGKGQRATPPLQVVHLPPGQESRTGDKLPHFLLRIAQSEQHLPPYTFLPHDGQWQVHPMQGHPVNLLLPAVPVPESHRIGERAVVEVIAQGKVRLMAFLLPHLRQHGRQLRLHLIPGEMHPRIVFQVPVHARGNIHPCVATDHHPLPLLIQFKEVAVSFHQFRLKLPGCSRVNTVQQIIHGIPQNRHHPTNP